MDLQLNGKRALVTGSSTGVGEGIAKVLAQEGAIVAVHGRDEDRTNGVAEGIVAKGGKAFAVTGDLATDEDAQQVANKTLAVLGDVDILVNNAGIYGNSGWMDTTPDDWAHIYNINVISMVRLIRHFAPRMKELGWGRIIQIARANELAEQLLRLDPFTRRYTRLMFTRKLKRRVIDELPFDMGLEGLSIVSSVKSKE